MPFWVFNGRRRRQTLARRTISHTVFAARRTEHKAQQTREETSCSRFAFAPMTAPATLYPFSEDGISRAVADAMAMKTVKSTIMPWPELAE
jgi:hypothetical protein